MLARDQQRGVFDRAEDGGEPAPINKPRRQADHQAAGAP